MRRREFFALSGIVAAVPACTLEVGAIPDYGPLGENMAKVVKRALDRCLMQVSIESSYLEDPRKEHIDDLKGHIGELRYILKVNYSDNFRRNLTDDQKGFYRKLTSEAVADADKTLGK
jgi:hypothetical protein